MLQVGLFAIGAWQAVGMVLFSLLQRVCSPQWRAVHVRLPALGTLPLNGVLAAGASGALCATWAAQYNAPWTWPLQVQGRRSGELGEQLCGCMYACRLPHPRRLERT